MINVETPQAKVIRPSKDYCVLKVHWIISHFYKPHKPNKVCVVCTSVSWTAIYTAKYVLCL